MSDRTAISWCDSTFNPWIGCTKVSPACEHCYAARQDAFRKWTPEGWGGPRRRTSAANWRLPKTWDSLHEGFMAAYGRRRRVFCASLADVFDNEVPPEWRAELFDLIHTTPNLDWLLLTKRIGNAAAMLRESAPWDPSKPPAHVWLGATICNQPELDRDYQKLAAVPARVRFLSIEPMLGAVDLQLMQGHVNGWRAVGIDWVICGGESGPQARPLHPDWVRSLRDQCAAAGVPFHFKQWGEWVSVSEVAGDGRHHSFPDGATVRRVGVEAAGRLLDGAEHNGFPA